VKELLIAQSNEPEVDVKIDVEVESGNDEEEDENTSNRLFVELDTMDGTRGVINSRGSNETIN